MPEKVVSSAVANAAYDVLVEECGVYDDENSIRYAFIDWMTRQAHAGETFRFDAKFGFSGKFHVLSGNNAPIMMVSCYFEDKNSSRAEMIDRANKRLVEIMLRQGSQNQGEING